MVGSLRFQVLILVDPSRKAPICIAFCWAENRRTNQRAEWWKRRGLDSYFSLLLASSGIKALTPWQYQVPPLTITGHNKKSDWTEGLSNHLPWLLLLFFFKGETSFPIIFYGLFSSRPFKINQLTFQQACLVTWELMGAGLAKVHSFNKSVTQSKI